METITTLEELSKAIQTLETKSVAARTDLVRHANLAYEIFTPASLLKLAFNDSSVTSLLNSKFTRTSAALLFGYLTKSIFIGSSHGWLRTTFGNFLFVSLTNIMLGNPTLTNTLKSWFKKVRSTVMSKVRKYDTTDDRE